MQQLILKEFFLQKKMFPFYFLIPILSVFRNSVEPMGIAIGLFITCSTIIYISFYYDEKSKVEKVLVSLPIMRKEIVIAKYISSTLFIIARFERNFYSRNIRKYFVEQRYSYSWICNIFSNSSNFDLLCSNDTY